MVSKRPERVLEDVVVERLGAELAVRARESAADAAVCGGAAIDARVLREPEATVDILCSLRAVASTNAPDKGS